MQIFSVEYSCRDASIQKKTKNMHPDTLSLTLSFFSLSLSHTYTPQHSFTLLTVGSKRESLNSCLLKLLFKIQGQK